MENQIENQTVKVEPGDRVVITDPASSLMSRVMIVRRANETGVILSPEGSTAVEFLRYDQIQLLRPHSVGVVSLVRIKPLASIPSNFQWGVYEGRKWPVEAHDKEGVWIKSAETGCLQLFRWDEIEIDEATPLSPPTDPPPVKTTPETILTEECMDELADRVAKKVARLIKG